LYPSTAPQNERGGKQHPKGKERKSEKEKTEGERGRGAM